MTPAYPGHKTSTAQMIPGQHPELRINQITQLHHTLKAITAASDKLRAASFNITDTLKASLPLSHIMELRALISDGASSSAFTDWHWAQRLTQDDRDWFVVDRSMIDEKDRDCVWRQRAPSKREKNKGLSVVYELWSPARAVGVFVMLHLPLRPFQVCALDSGEADTYRYESGNWVLNTSHLTTGDHENVKQHGVFHRAPAATGADNKSKQAAWLYINISKTAYICQTKSDTGYIIPWNHEVVLYWLQKLRNWQEKYNPLPAPTSWCDLATKHVDRLYRMPVVAKLGTCCFLFRDASAEGNDRWKPVTSHGLECLWHNLLSHFDDLRRKRGETPPSKKALELVSRENKTTSYVSLHNLRSSLIAAYTRCLIIG